MEPVTPMPARRARQLRLFTEANPLGQRLGAEFFRALPAGPGVYFFHDAEGTLLYIGQSHDLRARVGSYRHVTPERHPKRILRLVRRIARVEWRECATPAEAKELERVLLLEKRPPFNRAGVWPGYAWWLTVRAHVDAVEVRLSRHALPHPGCAGPLPPGYRHAHSSLMRCMHRLLHPEQSLAEYPLGLLDHAAPLHLRLRTREPARVASVIADFAAGNGSVCLAELPAILAGAPPLELEYWTTELEALQKFAAKRKSLPVSTLSFPAALVLPLFPDL